MPHTVLAILDRTETAPQVLAASAVAAAQLGSSRSGPAQIEALHVRHNASEGFMPTEDVMTKAHRQEIDSQANRLSTQLLGLFEAWRQAGGAGCWREITGETAQIVAQEAANADLVVIGRPSLRRPVAGQQALHAALFDVRRLTLLVPDTVPPTLGRQVVVAWKPSEAADRAIEAALPLLLRADRVTVLIGAEERSHLEEPATLRQNFMNFTGQFAVRRFHTSGRAIGQALLAEAHMVNADLLVMGAYTHSRFAEMVFGGATRDILSHADLPVLLHH